MILLLALVASSTAWACDKPASAAQLLSAVSGAEVAFAQLDERSFDENATRARELLPCQAKPLRPADAAAYHRLEALTAFLAGDRARVVQQFQAVRSVEPTYVLPQILAPANHPLRADFDLAQDLQSPMKPLPTPSDGATVIDGTPAREVPTARPYVFQHVIDERAVLTQAIPVNGDAPRYRSRESQLNVPLIAAGGASLVLSGVLYGVASSSAKTFDDPSTPKTDLNGLRNKTNNLVYASLGVGAVGVGAATFGVIGGSF